MAAADDSRKGRAVPMAAGALSTHITMRVTKEEAFEVSILAANDKSVSAYIRRLIIQDKKSRRTK